MLSLSDILKAFVDTLTGHLALSFYLLAVIGERQIARRLKKLPFLLPSPLIAILLSVWLYAIPGLRVFQYYITSFVILIMCTLWVRRTWGLGGWQSFSATCMAGIFQVAGAAVSMMAPIPFAAAIALHLCVSIGASLLLYKLSFGSFFRLLLDNNPAPWRIALLSFALEAVMELFLKLAFGIQPRFLTFYYLLVVTTVILITALIVYLARHFDTARKIQAWQDMIAQQQLYEQDLEMIRREVRAFRHDYKNLLAGLSFQAGEGELDRLRHSLSELDTGFDQRIGQKIQASTQIGNIQIPEVRSLLLSKLTAMRKKGVKCHLEALYPIVAANMDIWDFVRCLGILIDNAMEAALDTEQPWVEIIMLSQDEQVLFRVSNPYTNTIDPGKMWNDGWSTKGTGRGLGLSGYQRILENYPNTSIHTSWENNIFIQEITVEDRS